MFGSIAYRWGARKLTVNSHVQFEFGSSVGFGWVQLTSSQMMPQAQRHSYSHLTLRSTTSASSNLAFAMAERKTVECKLQALINLRPMNLSNKAEQALMEDVPVSRWQMQVHGVLKHYDLPDLLAAEGQVPQSAEAFF